MSNDARYAADGDLPPARIPGVAVTGTIGAGKTAVAEALSSLLHERQIRHALLDVDWLGQVYPPPDPDDPFSLDLALDNLALIAPNYVAAGTRCFVIAVTLTSQDELIALKAALPQVDLSVCLLTASAETRARRIEARDSGALRDDFLQRTDALHEQIASLQIHDFDLSNDETQVNEVASDLLETLGWATLE